MAAGSSSGEKNTPMVPGPSRSQITCSAAGSAQLANPLDSSVNPIPAPVAWRLAHSWPLSRTLIGYGKYAQILMKTGPNRHPRDRNKNKFTRRSALKNENHGTPLSPLRCAEENTF